MLEQVNGSIQEVSSNNMFIGGTYDPCSGASYLPNSTVYWNWNGYPVYVYSDKTKKAIDVLKALEAAKLIKCTSVPKFIALVEQIAGLL